MQGLIEVEPKQYLEFQQDDTKLGHCTLTITNLQKEQLSYKIKTTLPTSFQVKPSVGLIAPEQQAVIDIQTNHPIKATDKLDAKFQILSSICEGGDLISFWKNKDLNQAQVLQLRSRVVRDDQAPQQEPPETQQQSLNESQGVLYKSIQEQSPSRVDEMLRCKEQIAKLEQQLADSKIIYQSLEQQYQQKNIMQNDNSGSKIELKHLIIAILVALILGYLIAK